MLPRGASGAYRRTTAAQVLPWLDLQLHPLLCESQVHDGAFQALLDAVMAYLAGESTLESCLSALEAGS